MDAKEFIHEAAAVEGADLSPELRGRLEKSILALLEGHPPSEAWGISPETMDTFYQHAHQLYQTGKFDEAFNFFSTLMLFDPASYRYTFGAAAAQHKLGHFSEAAGLYEWCAEIHPFLPDPHSCMYNCFLKLAKHEAAERELEKVLELPEGRKEYAQMREEVLTLKGKS